MASFNETVSYKNNYCLLSKPVDPTAPPGQAINIALGLCMPEKCNRHDITELVNIGISLLDDSNVTLPFLANLTNITDDYVICHKAAEVDSGAVFAL